MLTGQGHERVAAVGDVASAQQFVVAVDRLHADDATEPVGSDHAPELFHHWIRLAAHVDAESDFVSLAGGMHAQCAIQVASHGRMHQARHALFGGKFDLAKAVFHRSGQHDEVDAICQELRKALRRKSDVARGCHSLRGSGQIVVHVVKMKLTSTGPSVASRAPRWNSGNSSRNSTPRWASDTSPGRARWPPPINAATEAE